MEEDRAGVTSKYPEALARCWPIDDRGNVDPNGSKIVLEYKGIGTGFTADSPGKGCQCQWTNWKLVPAAN